jgi:hypothetical protein
MSKDKLPYLEFLRLFEYNDDPLAITESTEHKPSPLAMRLRLSVRGMIPSAVAPFLSIKID